MLRHLPRELLLEAFIRNVFDGSATITRIQCSELRMSADPLLKAWFETQPAASNQGDGPQVVASVKTTNWNDWMHGHSRASILTAKGPVYLELPAKLRLGGLEDRIAEALAKEALGRCASAADA